MSCPVVTSSSFTGNLLVKVDEPTTVLFDKNRKPVTVLKSDMDKFVGLLKENSENHYQVYQSAPELYSRLMPLFEQPWLIRNETLTNEQAKKIFPFMAKAELFDLIYCPKLTGECLSDIPESVHWLSAPKNTSFNDLKNLSEGLRYLFIYNISNRESVGGMDLTGVPLIRIQIPAPVEKHERFMQLLPAETLELCDISGGNLDDEDVRAFLRSAKKLKSLWIARVASVTAAAFDEIPDSITLIDIGLCPSVDKEAMLAKMTSTRKINHMTVEEYEKREKWHRLYEERKKQEEEVKKNEI